MIKKEINKMVWFVVLFILKENKRKNKQKRKNIIETIEGLMWKNSNNKNKQDEINNVITCFLLIVLF